MAAVFARHPTAALVFGQVIGPAYDWRTQHLLTFEVKAEHEVTRLFPPTGNH